MVKGNDDNNFDSTERLLKLLNELEASRLSNRRNDLLKLVRAQYEDLFRHMDCVPHPIYGDRG